MLDEIKELFNIDESTSVEFRKIYGFTFAFQTRVISINDKLTSGEIKPLAIIYEENDEIYLAPLDEPVNIDRIIKSFVEKSLKK